MTVKTAVVTGGAGFLGSHLVEELVGRNWRVRVVDDLSTGKVRNLRSVKDRIDFRRTSVLNGKAMSDAFEDADAVFHLAAKVSVAESLEKPELYARVNVAGLIQALAIARKQDVARFVFPSSAAVYADGGPSRKTERSALGPRSPYAVTKVLGEALCRVCYEDQGLETVIMRFFNVYGTRQDPGSPYSSVIPRFLDALTHDQRPVIYGDGMQTRDFIYVKDAVEAMIVAVSGKVAGEDFNIASGRATTILQLLEATQRALGKKTKPRFAEAREGEVRHSCASIAKARRVLGFSPRFALDEGLRGLVRG